MARLDPEVKLRRRVIRFLARVRSLTANEVQRHLDCHIDETGLDYHCPRSCRVAAVERERKRLAELLGEGKGQ